MVAAAGSSWSVRWRPREPLRSWRSAPCTTCTAALAWEQFTTSFVASGATTLVTFLNGDGLTDNSNGLDNVVLTDLGPVPVPAPSIGFGLPVFLAVGGLWFGARLLERSRRGAGLFAYSP